MIRSLQREDIPSVCALFARTFRSGKNHDRAALAAAIEATFLTAPDYSPERGSVVHIDEQGNLTGFMGLVNMRLRLGARTLHAAVLSSYMADRPKSNPLVGAGLIRAVLARKLDVVFTDTANRTSLDMSRALRFEILPFQSLDWIKILKPVGTAVNLLGRRGARWSQALIRPAAGLDALMPRLAATSIDERSIEESLDRPLTAAEFIVAAPEFVSTYTLRPSWDAQELSWLLQQASLQTKYGPLHMREVLDHTGRRAGIYLLYGRKSGVANALQVLSEPGREDMVMGNLILFAKNLGAVSVKGSSSREAALGLLWQNGVIYRHIMNMVVWTRDAEVSAALKNGKVCLGGLAGETWARIFSDSFDE